MALADKVAESFGFNDFLPQTGVLYFELRFETLDFFKCPRIGDGSANMISEDSPPG